MTRCLLLVFSLALIACADEAESEASVPDVEESLAPKFEKITPVLLAEDVQACVTFWERLGMTTTMRVPHEDGIGFAALSAGDVELMYQSFAMSRAQNPAAIEGVERAVVYIEVQSIEDLQSELGGTHVVVPLRETGHGTRELYVRDPAGNLIGFSETTTAQR